MKASLQYWLSRLALSTALLLGGAAPMSVAAQAPKEEVAIYSAMCVHPEGDLLEDRVILVKSFGDYYVLFQTSGGWAQPPFLGPAVIAGSSFNVEVHLRGEAPTSFHGTITPQEITGGFLNGRKNSFGSPIYHWKRKSIDPYTVPDC
jgi:hypothetical protein